MKFSNSISTSRSVFIALFLSFFSIILIAQLPDKQAENRYIRLRIIEVSSKSLADRVVERFKEGESFRKLARQHSLHSSAAEGGELGWIEVEEREDDFWTALKGLPTGSMSSPIQREEHFFLLYKANEFSEREYQTWQKRKAQLDSLVKEINQEQNRTEFEEQLNMFKQAETLARELDDEKALYSILNVKASLFLSAYRLIEAIRTYQQLANRAAASGQQAWQGYARGSIGQAYHALGSYPRAIAYFDSALVIARAIGDRKNEGVRLGNIGLAYLNLSSYLRAIAYFDSALIIARAIDDQKNEATWLGNTGLAYLNLDNYPSAIAYFDSALVLAHFIGDQSGERTWSGNIGLVYLNQGNYPRAIARFDSALVIARNGNDQRSEGVWLGSIGQAYLKQGNYPNAIAYFDSALVIARAIGDQKNEGAWLGSIGRAYLHLGGYPRAIACFDSALVITRAIGNHKNEGSLLGSIGQAYLALGNYSRAITYFDSALVLTREIGDQGNEGVCLGSIGQAYLSLGSYPRAIAYFDSALTIAQAIGDQQNEGANLGSIGQAYHSLGSYPRAIAYFDSALAIARNINDRQGEGVRLGNIGQVYYSLGSYPRAIAYFDSALAIARNIGDREAVWSAHWHLAQSYSKTTGYSADQIIEHFEKALQALDDITGELTKDVHKRFYLENKQGLYRDYIAYLIKQPQASQREKALEISEASRTRALRDLLQGQQVQAPLSLEKRQTARRRNAELFRSYQDTLIAEAQRNESLRGATEESLESWADGIAIPPDTLGSAEGAPAIGLREIRGEARRYTLLEYHVLEDGVAIWVVTRQGNIYTHKQNIAYDSLYALINSARQELGISAIENRNVKIVQSDMEPALADKAVLRTVDSLLIRPVEKYLPKDSTRHLVIVAHDILFLLPFGCLIDDSGKYLSERYAFSTAPSIGLLKFTRARERERQEKENPRLLLLGNPAMPDTTLWDALPGAENEVLLVARHVNQMQGEGYQEKGARALQALPLTGKDATEEEYRRIAAIQNYLHLATHGYVVSNALRCGIILAKTGNTMETDGVLTTAEIFGLPLNADLVVLSACETGLGEISSDGIAGLTRAFLYAGASSLIVSLWKVPDAATQHLMVKFYEELAKDGNKARALRAAQNYTRKTYPNPRDWAAFVLYGEK